MIIMLIGAIIALVFGKISITRSWKLKGKYARLFGLALLILAFPVSVVLSVLLTLLAPSLVVGYSVQSVLANLVLSVLVVALLAYPFVLWQRSEESTNTKAISDRVLVLIGSALLLLALGFFFLFKKGTNAFEALTKQNDEGVAQGMADGSGKTVKDCFNQFRTKDPFFRSNPADLDSSKIKDAMDQSMRAGGYLEGCLSVSSDRKAFCDSIPKDFKSPEYGVWEQKVCTDFAIPAKDCTVQASSLSMKCSLASMKDLMKK